MFILLSSSLSLSTSLKNGWNIVHYPKESSHAFSVFGNFYLNSFIVRKCVFIKRSRMLEPERSHFRAERPEWIYERSTVRGVCRWDETPGCLWGNENSLRHSRDLNTLKGTKAFLMRTHIRCSFQLRLGLSITLSLAGFLAVIMSTLNRHWLWKTWMRSKESVTAPVGCVAQ